MRLIGISSLVLGIACIAGILCQPDSAAGDKEDAKSPEKLDGKWYVVRQEEHENVVPAAVTKRLTMVIDGNKMEWYIGNPAPNFVATLTIDEEKKTIDAKVTRGSFIGKTMLGIYKFEKGQLHMCWSEFTTDKRPEKFATTKRGGGLYNYTIYAREPAPQAPPELGSKTPPGKKPPPGTGPKLTDLKFTLPEGWEAKHREGTNTWEISHDFATSVVAGWALAKHYPKNLDDYVEKLQKNGDHFAYGIYWTSVTDKGKLPDGLYVVGKVKTKDDKEAKETGFSIIRDLGGEKVIFESFGNRYDDAKLLKEAMDICKTAKF
jgi:uncharacterized protein (TIGR03067 family)